MFAIGIGRRLNTTELHCIADNPVNGQDRVFQFKSFKDFQKAVGKSAICVYKKKIAILPNSETLNVMKIDLIYLVIISMILIV